MPLVVHPHFHPRRTGVTRHVEAVVPALAPHMEARTLGTALAPGLPHIRWRELWARLWREPLLWHAHRNNELLCGLLLRALSPMVRVVFTRHSAPRPGRWTQWLAGRADQVLSLSEPMAEALGVPSHVVPHGVELQRFSPPADRAAAWRALGLGGAHGVGVLGRVRPSKGQGDFVEAVAPLLARAPGWRAVLVGDVRPSERDWAEGLRARAGGALSLVGEQREVVPWYHGLTVVVQPSHSEGFSLVLLEAMASGCCVVAARLPHFSALVEHGRTGFLYPPGDVQALRSLLEGLFAEPARALRVGEAAAAEARRRFGVEHEARALAHLYAPLLGSSFERG